MIEDAIICAAQCGGRETGIVKRMSEILIVKINNTGKSGLGVEYL